MTDSLLLIDDDADVLRSVGDYFERIGYEVHRAATGHAGVEAFERVRPDVVILDLHLPDLSGMEVLERLRGSGAAVILITGQILGPELHGADRSLDVPFSSASPSR